MIYQWYHWQQKNVQGFLVTIGKNGTNSTIGRFADFTIGRTPNAASMFWSKNKRNRYTPVHPFYYVKVGYKVVYNNSWTCYPDEKKCKAMSTEN